MEYEFAPLEGITDAVFRRSHRAFYPGIDRYYTPFISPTHHHVFTNRQLRELDPGNNTDVPLVPQLLGRNPADIRWAMEELAAMGYGEVNLNLGCPSGTVTAKGKGAGLLADPRTLDEFLDGVFTDAPVRISVKTRLGLTSPEEFPALLAVFNSYPICRLIIHARTRTQHYGGVPDRDVFRAAAGNTSLSLSYNGDLFTPGDCMDFQAAFPDISAVMLGRGLTADPALVVKLRGGAGGKDILYRFLRVLGEEYCVLFGGPGNALHRMKAIWHYVLFTFRDGDSYRKRIIKARRWEDYSAVTEEIFQRLELLPAAEPIHE